MKRGVGSAQAPQTEVGELLDGLHTVQHEDKPLAPAMIAWYK